MNVYYDYTKLLKVANNSRDRKKSFQETNFFQRKSTTPNVSQTVEKSLNKNFFQRNSSYSNVSLTVEKSLDNLKTKKQKFKWL